MNLQNKADVRAFYQAFAARCQAARTKLGRPLTLTEKILAAHLHQAQSGSGSTYEFPDNFTALERGKSHVALRPDRVAMQDATAQMALLQYIQAGLKEVAVPTSIHCDHLIRAKEGSFKDLTIARSENIEVYDFLRSAAARHGIAFGAPGKGIIHQVVLENLAFPGGLMIGTDSHTPNAGGLTMLAIGVGGADAVEVMAGEPWALAWPTLIGVKLTGKLNGWASPKDVILKLAGILGSSGGTGAVIEYFGETGSMSCTGQATIANMGAELGATTSTFPFSEAAATYLRSTGRADLADIAAEFAADLKADSDVEANPEKYFDRVIEIDLTTLEPHVVGPYTPDLARPISEFAAEVKAKGYPENLRFALIGSCTNSSYEDMGRAAHIARQAAAHGAKAKCGFLITPGSTQIHATIERDGQMQALEAVGGQVMANACGPCIGQWQRSDVANDEPNSIINSFNRPFKGRNDNNAGTHAFIASPEIVTAFALAGTLSFNPLTDELVGADGKPFKLTAPAADELPPQGFVTDPDAVLPARYNELTQVEVRADSDRLQLLAPFAAFSGSESEYSGLPVLLKAVGKCTTDHISPAGVQWLRFRGHLDKISDNMFSRAINAFASAPGTGVDQLDGSTATLAAIARHYKAEGLGWVAVGDVNYGEGSSREHAAMSPRFLGCKAVIVRSFARIHRSNLQKQGLLALTFADPADYDKIKADDRVSLKGVTSLAPGVNLTLELAHKDGSVEAVQVVHGLTAEQIDWFKAGSFLNMVRVRHEAVNSAEDTSAVEDVGCCGGNHENGHADGHDCDHHDHAPDPSHDATDTSAVEDVGCCGGASSGEGKADCGCAGGVCANPHHKGGTNNAADNASKKADKSLWQRFWTWFWGLFGS